MTRRRALSLRARILAGVALVAVVLVVVAAIVTATTRSQLVAQVDDRLRSADIAVRAVPPPVDDEAGTGDGRIRRRGARGVSDIYVGFMGDDGELRSIFLPDVPENFSPPDIDVESLRGPRVLFFTTAGDSTDITLRVRAVEVDGGYSITAVSLDGVRATMRRLMLLQIGASAAILAALGVLAWWVLRLGIRPIKEMTTTATRIADGDLAVRVPESQPGTESGDLAIALNRMMGTINAAIDEQAAGEERLRRFVADASHELRTPVTTIRGYAELYRHGGLPTGEPLDDAMRRTEQEAVRMGRLVEDMLLLAKLDQSRPMARRPVDVAAILRDTAADATVNEPDREFAVDVPDEPVTIIGDEDRIRQIVVNLVGNAMVHTPPGTSVALRARRDDDGAIVEVSDEGPGMPPEIVAKAMERFYRADAARSRAAGGSGLGLSIVDAVVRAHGGSIEIDSELGAGTTVRFRLPGEPAAATDGAAVTPSTPARSG